MRVAPPVELTAEERSQLEKWSRGHSQPHQLVLRSKSVLLAADGLQNKQIAQRLTVHRNSVDHWRRMFLAGRLTELQREASRPGRPHTVTTPEMERRVVDTVRLRRPLRGTRWSVRSLAEALHMEPTAVYRTLRKYRLQPHRTRGFKFSNDPHFEEKLRDVVGLYLNPPEHALVLSFDEKSQIQALNRTQLILPIRPGLPEGRSHDYRRNGTTTLLAMLNMLDGKVIGSCTKRHRHQEFLRFLEKVEGEVPSGLDLHVILDNYSAHKHARVKNWLRRHTRWHLHFIPTHSSFLNMVERWLGKITDEEIRRGTYGSVQELTESIELYLKNYNSNPTVYTWTASADDILRKIGKLRELYGIPGPGWDPTKISTGTTETGH